MLPSFRCIHAEIHGPHVLLVAFNRPHVYNALSPDAYDEWLAALRWAAAEPRVRAVVLTGNGPYYSAGQQLSPPPKTALADPRAYFVARVAVTKALVDCLIAFPKLLFVAVNGPAVGIAATTLALADIVYSVPHATFRTPFMDLALCVEACSSVTFPRALGPAKAKDMLFLGRTMTAKEWESAGLITEILPAEGFREAVLAKAAQAAQYSPTAVQESLKLVRLVDRDLLLKMNELELQLLVERLVSEDFTKAVLAFHARSKAKKEAEPGKPAKL